MPEDNFFLQEWLKKNLPLKLLDTKWHNVQENIQEYSEQIKKNIQKMGDFENTKLLTPKTLKEIYDNFRSDWKKHKTFQGMSPKQLREVMFILFANPNDGVKHGIYSDSEQFKAFMKVLIQKNQQSSLRRLISELLYYYPLQEEKNLLFERLSKIYRALDKNKSSNLLLFEANRKFKLIEESGPKMIAKQILNLNKNIKDLLQEIWIKEKHLSHGIGESIVKEICYMVKHNISQENEVILDRFLEYLSGESISSH